MDTESTDKDKGHRRRALVTDMCLQKCIQLSLNMTIN